MWQVTTIRKRRIVRTCHNIEVIYMGREDGEEVEYRNKDCRNLVRFAHDFRSMNGSKTGVSTYPKYRSMTVGE